MGIEEIKVFRRKIKSIASVFTVFLAAVLLLSFGTGGADTGDEEGVYLPVIMYHSFLKDTSLHNDYTISPDVLEKDLIYFSDNGYTTVTVSDLVDYVYNDKALPEKCVMLTFDDGYYNNYYYAYPLLKKYKAKAVISPIASMTERFSQTRDISPTYGHISAKEINEMIASGCAEIQNHSYDMHSLAPRRGAAMKKGESYEDYKRTVTDDLSRAQAYLKDNTDANPVCFVYPFGEESEQTLDIIKEMGFLSTLTCTEKPNIINKNAESLYELGRYRRDGGESTASLMKRIESDYKGE